MAFEVALLVAFKTKRNGFRNNFCHRQKTGQNLGSQFILALGFGVLKKIGGSGKRGQDQGKRNQRGAESEGKKTSRSQTKRQEEHQTAEQAAKDKFVARVAAG